jgi:hypothetical protein
MTDISLLGKIVQKNMCGDGKEMKGLPSRNAVYGYTFVLSFIYSFIHIEVCLMKVP